MVGAAKPVGPTASRWVARILAAPFEPGILHPLAARQTEPGGRQAEMRREPDAGVGPTEAWAPRGGRQAVPAGKQGRFAIRPPPGAPAPTASSLSFSVYPSHSSGGSISRALASGDLTPLTPLTPPIASVPALGPAGLGAGTLFSPRAGSPVASCLYLENRFFGTPHDLTRGESLLRFPSSHTVARKARGSTFEPRRELSSPLSRGSRCARGVPFSSSSEACSSKRGLGTSATFEELSIAQDSRRALSKSQTLPGLAALVSMPLGDASRYPRINRNVMTPGPLGSASSGSQTARGLATQRGSPPSAIAQQERIKANLDYPGPRASGSSLSQPIRGLATQGGLPAGAVAHQKPIKIYVQSPGILADPYRPPDPPLPFLRSWLSGEGWRRRRDWFMDALRTGYAIALLRRTTKNYTRNGFYSEVAHNYSKIIQALAADDRTGLRHFVTESVFTSMKAQLKQRGQAGAAKVEWRLAGGAPKISTLQARLVALDKKNPENSFVQVTLKIVCKQIVAVYDKKGKLLAGNPSEEIPVEDVWVFERHLQQPDSPWRLCGQLLQAGAQKLPVPKLPGKSK